jgi:hypothetical protein
MTEDRIAVMDAVLRGDLPPDAVTLEELEFVEHLLFEMLCDKLTPFATHETIQ